MKTALCLLLSLILCAAGFASSMEIKKEEIPFPGGNPKMRYRYFEQDGQKILHGLYQTFYASGAVWEQYLFDCGKLHGKCSERNADGGKKWTGEFIQDVRVGKWTYWDRNGVKKMEATFDKSGKLQTMVRYNSVGKKIRAEWHENGQIVREKSWKKNGILQRDPRVEQIPVFNGGGGLIQKPVIEPAKNAG